MSYTIEQRDRALIVTWHADFNFITEGATLTADLSYILEHVDQPVYFINDVRDAPMSFAEIAAAADMAAHSERSLFHHPKICGSFAVTGCEMTDPIKQGLQRDMNTHARMRMVPTLAVALALIDE